jgi:hypothetical protein
MTVEPHSWLPYLPFFIMPVSWIGILWAVAKLGGWRELAKHYPAPGAFQGKRWWFCSAQMQYRTSYRGALIIGSNAQGIWLRPLFLFRFGHPAIFIPWGDITYKLEEGFFSSFEFRFRACPKIPLRVLKGLGTKILNECHRPLHPV